MGWQDAPLADSSAPAWASAPMVSQSAPTAQPSSPSDPSLLMAPVGGAEMLLKRVTGALAALPAGVAYGGAAIGKAAGADVNPSDVQNRVQQYLTYQPVTASGQAGERQLSAMVQPIVKPIAQKADQFASSVGQVSPTAEAYLREAPAALQAATGVIPLIGPAAQGVSALNDSLTNLARSGQGWRAAEQTPEEVLRQTYTDSPQSQGSAAAAPSITNVSPGLRQGISQAAQKTGGVVNPEVLERRLEADRLPVKVQLTEGQATRDPVLYSEEQNLRGKHTQLATTFGAQNDKLVQNVQTIRDQVGPDVFSTNAVEHGDTLISAYKDIDKAASGKIDAAYQAARDMVPDKTASVVNAPDLLANVTKALHEQDLFDSAPKDIMATLGRRSESNSMSFANIENLKTNLARIQRSFSTDGNTRYAAGIIRDQIEQAPLTVDNEAVKAAYDNARSLARQRFQTLEADPAYKAAVYDSVAPDKFVKKFVINGNRDEVATMAQNLAANEPAKQTLSVAAIDHLRDAAGIGPDYKGSFKQAGYNKALQALDAKLGSLVSPQTAEQLQSLGNVAHNIQAPPPGHTVNTSNTLTAGMSDYATGALEKAVNSRVPLAGTIARKVGEHYKYGARVRQALAPGAGLERLSVPNQLTQASGPNLLTSP